METGPHRGPKGSPLTFVALMVDAFGSPLASHRGPAIDICRVDGGRSRISVSTSQGSHRWHFLTLMVATPVSLALVPPRGAAIDIF
jgi:hypothetical protein